MKAPSPLESEFLTRWRQIVPLLPLPASEFQFCETRRFRFDYAWPSERVAVELEGATWKNGRHTRGEGYAKDCEKYNLATALGWRIFRFTSDMLRRDPIGCIDLVVAALKRLDINIVTIKEDRP